MTDSKPTVPVAYLDHAATTAMRPSALAALAESAAELGNPSSLHSAGRRSRRIVEESREIFADELGVRPSDVVFTSGGTEADNLAIKGLYWAAVAKDPARTTLLVSTIEHHAVLDAVEWLVEHEGACVEWIPARLDGRIEVGWLAEFLRRDASKVALCAVMWANNETGVIQPVESVAALCDEFEIPFHCDAVQGVACLAWPSVGRSANSSLAISAHKFGGPVGVGALVVNGLTPQPLFHGGGQEIDVRSGTVATALISSAAVAFDEAARQRSTEVPRVAALSEQLRTGVLHVAPDAVIIARDSERLAGISSISFPGCQADALLMLLDSVGVACSAGSACTAGVPRPSHVLLAMGMPVEQAQATLRFSLGWSSAPSDVEALLSALSPVLERARRANRGGTRSPAKVGTS